MLINSWLPAESDACLRHAFELRAYVAWLFEELTFLVCRSIVIGADARKSRINRMKSIKDAASLQWQWQ